MNKTGGADRSGPAPNAQVRETQKARSGAASPQGLHGPLLLGCGQGLAPHRFIGKRRAVSPGSGPWDAHKDQTRQLRPIRQVLLPPANARGSGQCPPPPAPCGQRGTGYTRPSPAPPLPAPCTTVRVSVRYTIWRQLARKARPPRSGSSAPGPRKALRDQIVAGVHAVHRDRGERPPIGIGAEPRDHDLSARQQPRQGNPRGFARGKVTTQA